MIESIYSDAIIYDIEVLKRKYKEEYEQVKAILLKIRELPDNYDIGIHHTTKLRIAGIVGEGLRIQEKSYEIGSGKIALENSVMVLGTTKCKPFSKGENVSDEEYLELIDSVFKVICIDTKYGSSSVITFTPSRKCNFFNFFSSRNELSYRLLIPEFIAFAILAEGTFVNLEASFQVLNNFTPDFAQKANLRLNQLKKEALINFRSQMDVFLDLQDSYHSEKKCK